MASFYLGDVFNSRVAAFSHKPLQFFIRSPERSHGTHLLPKQFVREIRRVVLDVVFVHKLSFTRPVDAHRIVPQPLQIYTAISVQRVRLERTQ